MKNRNIKIILWMTSSLNGFIARENNQEDFISDASWASWVEDIHKSKCLIWGRKTYETVKDGDRKYLNDLNGVRVIVVSRNVNFKVDNKFKLVSSPEEATEVLEREGYKDIILTGGSILNSSFAELGLIDEIIVNLESVVIGKGIPLFNFTNFSDLKLELIETRQISNSLFRLHYKVIK